MALDSAREMALVGGVDGSSATWSITDRKILQVAQGAGNGIHDVLVWKDSSAIIATTSGEVAVLENGEKVLSFTSHSGPATALALHPSGDLLASVGQQDRSLVLYDLPQQKEIARIITDSRRSLGLHEDHQLTLSPALTCCQFHPDGHLLAAGTGKGQVKLFDVKSSALAATFDLSGRIQALSFSENGFWLAIATTGSSTASIWDLRKTTEIKALDFGCRIDSIKFDYTGQFLAGAGSDGVAVHYYDKGSKSWSEPLRKALAAGAVEWGSQAKSLIVLAMDGAVSVLQ